MDLPLSFFLLHPFLSLFSFHRLSVNSLNLQLTWFLHCRPGQAVFILVTVCSGDLSPLTSHVCIPSFFPPLLLLKSLLILASWFLAFCYSLFSVLAALSVFRWTLYRALCCLLLSFKSHICVYEKKKWLKISSCPLAEKLLFETQIKPEQVKQV